MSKRRITPVLTENGSQRTADGGAASRDHKPIHQCECGGYVVWHQSKKSGKWYLADCFPYVGKEVYDSYWYAVHSPHFKSCKQEEKK